MISEHKNPTLSDMTPTIRIHRDIGSDRSNIIGEAVVTWPMGAEIRLNIVLGTNGYAIIRWPARKLPNGKMVYQARMTTRDGTEAVEKLVMDAWAKGAKP
jgi:hypothetical protein